MFLFQLYFCELLSYKIFCDNFAKVLKVFENRIKNRMEKREVYMCGICGYFGAEAVKKVCDGLKILEYRGYDSCGLAYVGDGKINSIKTLDGVDELIKKSEGLSTEMVIGHTRWATHGAVTLNNAHPHFSASKKLVMVHNGIVENFKELKKNIDIDFYSATDTEVFVNLIEKESGTLIEKVISASKKVKGAFAIIVLSESGEVVLGKRESPLYLSTSEKGVCVSSDVLALDGEKIYALGDDEFATIENSKILFFNKNGKKIVKKCEKIEKNMNFLQISFKTHMESEIFETKTALIKTLKKYKNEDVFSLIKLPKNFKSVTLVACGTAYHSSLVGAEFFKSIGIDARAYVASEFRYGREILSDDTLYIFVSQSGETADTIASAKLVRARKLCTLALTNTPNCLLNRVCKSVLPTFAGREVAVASTKAYCCQVFSLYLFSAYLAGKRLPTVQTLKKIPLLEFPREQVEDITKFEKVFFVGRELDHLTALEASLKLKEISYINSVAIASGELKHGTLALVDETSIVVAISTEKRVKEKLRSNLEEIKARGGKIVVFSCFDDFTDYNFVKIEKFADFLMPIVSIIPLQFLALRVAEQRGFNPDRPRNLAKSVTVE